MGCGCFQVGGGRGVGKPGGRPCPGTSEGLQRNLGRTFCCRKEQVKQGAGVQTCVMRLLDADTTIPMCHLQPATKQGIESPTYSKRYYNMHTTRLLRRHALALLSFLSVVRLCGEPLHLLLLLPPFPCTPIPSCLPIRPCRLCTSVASPSTQVVTHLCYSDFGDIMQPIIDMDGEHSKNHLDNLTLGNKSTRFRATGSLRRREGLMQPERTCTLFVFTQTLPGLHIPTRSCAVLFVSQLMC